MIKNIIFDFGNVLIRWDRQNLYRKVFNDDSTMQFFLDKVCTLDWNAQMDKGKSFDESIAERCVIFPKYKKEIQIYKDRWKEMLGGAIESSVQVLKHFHQSSDFEIYGLTNWSAETFPIAQKEFDFLHWFKGVVVSGEEDLIKPDERIYSLLLDRYHLNAEECLFIDDSIKNIEASRALGIHSIHFKDENSLHSELRNLKLIQ